MFCIHCGKKQPGVGRFCEACGRLLPTIEESGLPNPGGTGPTPELTPRQRQRIIEEERARIEAREEIEQERRSRETRFREDRERWEADVREKRHRAYLAKRARERRKRRYVIVGGVVAASLLFIGSPGSCVRDGAQPASSSSAAGAVLSMSAVAAPIDGAVDPILDAIASSDDFELHGELFVRLSTWLVDSGTCTLEDLAASDGWTRLQDSDGRARVYQTSCGPPASAASEGQPTETERRLYLDLSTGRVFR